MTERNMDAEVPLMAQSTLGSRNMIKHMFWASASGLTETIRHNNEKMVNIMAIVPTHGPRPEY
jgi:hypothetical protein